MRLFGNKIRESIEAFKPRHLGGGDRSTNNDKTKNILRIIFSIIVIVIGIFLCLDGQCGAAAGLLGTVLGYWIS